MRKMMCLTMEEFNQMEEEIKEARKEIAELWRKLGLGVSGDDFSQQAP